MITYFIILWYTFAFLVKWLLPRKKLAGLKKKNAVKLNLSRPTAYPGLSLYKDLSLTYLYLDKIMSISLLPNLLSNIVNISGGF